MAKERRVRYPLLWPLFIAAMFVGAALVSNPSSGWRWLGLALLLGPVIGLAGITLAYYLLERRRAAP